MFTLIFLCNTFCLRTDLPELQKVGEYSYSYGLAEKREQPLVKNRHSIGSSLGSVLRNMGNIDRKRNDKQDFDQVALISDNDEDDDDIVKESKPVKKTKAKKKAKNKRISYPTSDSNNLSQNEVEQLDGFKPSGVNGAPLDLIDPKKSVLQNLKKKHGILNTQKSNQKTISFNEYLDDPQHVRSIKSSLSRARILQNSKIDEAKVYYSRVFSNRLGLI